MTRNYIPHPIDTRHIRLPEELQALGERLAENTHENFVQLRMENGWTYGPARDDKKRQNPTLIPYEELTEEEKEYDRRTTFEVLRALLSLGYSIEKRR